MADVFVLKITLGNDAMKSADDIAEALRNAALRISYIGDCSTFGVVHDLNGNTVGGWEIQ